MNALLLLLVFPFSESSPTRRILHQPLFPASASPPPPPPPPPVGASPDQPFFPQPPDGSSSSQQQQTLLPPPPPPPPNSPPKPTKELAIAISVGMVTLGMLSALAFFIYKHKLKPSSNHDHHNKQQLPTSSHPTPFLQQQQQQHSHLSDPPPAPALLVSNDGIGKLNSVKKSNRYRPSPDLQPLPPLTTPRAVAPAVSDTDEALSSSSSSDELAAFYTPQGSVASSDDGFSTPASSSSRLGRKHPLIIPYINTTPPPPPPPPPPPLPVRTTWASASSRPAESHFTTPSNKDGATEIGSESVEGEMPKLKPLHWDKVSATSDRATVWDHLKSTSSSFQLNEDMMESLFGCNSNASTATKDSATRRSVLPPVEQQNGVLDPKKSQNIAILLRALNVTLDQLSDALLIGNQEALGAELLETLVKMAPTKEEEIKLKDYNGDSSKLGSAEKFLKAILDIPFAFRRVEAMLYRANFDAELKYLKKSFDTLETASGELKNSRLFLKLLEAVLRTGNRMNVGTNRGDAKAFKLDTLLKLVDIKGTDGKTTLLHFVVQEIIRSEGTDSVAATGNLPNQTNSRGKENEFRRQGLQMVSGLSRELGSVKLAAGMDSDVLHGYVSKLETGLEKVRTVLKLERPDMQGGFFESMKAFLGKAEEEIISINDDERKALMLVRSVTEYFHGNAAKEEAHPFRIFMIVRDFLSTLDHVCKDVGSMQDRTVMGAARSFNISTNVSLPVLNRYNVSRGNNSSEESPSP